MILEDISGKFDLVLEGQESLRSEMHGIRDDLSSKIDHNAFLINALNQKIEGVDDKLTAKIDGVDANLTAKIDGVEAKLTAKIEAVDTKLTARMDNLETNLSKRLDAVAEDLSAHRRDTEVHRGYQVRED